jgi:adenylosuccinate lyase
MSNVVKGLKRLAVAEQVMTDDLDENWEVLGEAIQTVMRAEALAGVEGMDNPYERLKDFTRGKHVDATSLKQFLETLGLRAEAEKRLSELTPHSYTGLAQELAQDLVKYCRDSC